MTVSPAPLPPYGTQALDCLFSHLAAGMSGEMLPAGYDKPFPVPSAPPDAVDSSEGEPPPQVENAADLRAAHQWLMRERQRLERYTRSQLTRIQQEHQAFVQQTYLKEQALVLRTQELNRKEEMLMHQAGALRQQAAALAERERKLAPYLDPLWKGQEELAELRRVSGGLRADVQGQRALLERWRLEMASWEKTREASEAESAARAAALREEKHALAVRQAEMDKRMLALEGAESAARRREAELNELEARLRRDFDEQEERLSWLRRENDGLARDAKGLRALLERLRVETASVEKARDAARAELAAGAAALRQQREALEARQAQMNQRLLDLGKAEAALGRRVAELDELEARLQRDGDKEERGLSFRRRPVETADSCCVQP